MFKDTAVCPDCGLIFERLNLATNKAGKKMINHGKRDKVIYVNDFPSDLNRYIVFTLALFLGLFGAHCFYVGRYIKGTLMAFGGVVTILGTILSALSIMPESINTLVLLIVGVQGFTWLIDCLNIGIKKFKVPVYIDLTEV